MVYTAQPEVKHGSMELDEHRRQAATSESLEARMPWLEGQVRRLQQQLDTKGKALAASDAAVSSLENKVQRLQRQLRQAEAHAGRAEGGASSREHDQEALELESELLRMEEALRVSKSAALRSAKEAERPSGPLDGNSSGNGGSFSFSDEQPERLRDGNSADGSIRASSKRSSRMSADSFEIPNR